MCSRRRSGSRAAALARAVTLGVVLAGLAPAALAAQAGGAPAGGEQKPDDKPWTAPPLFESDSVLHLTIRTDLRPLLDDRDSTERVEHPGTLTVAGPDGQPAVLDVRLRTRGHFRRKRSTCDFPPIRVSFGKEEDGPEGTKGTIFARQEDLKLVTRCRMKRGDYEQYILQEYALYRIMNLLTPLSFRARLLRVTYEDTAGRMDPFTTYAFFIEPEKDMARRNGGEILEVRGARLHDLVAEQAHLVAMFEYLIANVDWSAAGLHNIVLVQAPTGIFPVPYDLDWSGAVSTPYSSPADMFGIRSVRERLYRGYCVEPAALRPAIERIASRRAEVLAVLDSVPGLEPRRRDTMRRFLEDYFEIRWDEGRLKREISRKCLEP